MHITEAPGQAPDFFVSRAGADAAFAAEIGRILEHDGKTVVLQQWDFANRNFIERMHWALGSGARVIALLSNDYLASDHCAAEWQSAIAHDPLNRDGRLIVLRVAESTPSGLLTALAYWDLVPVRSNRDLVRDIVRAAVRPGRHKDLGAIGKYWRAPRPVVHPEIRPTSSFTGREAELAAIHDLLWSGRAAAVTQPVAAHGLGGIGKSVLAREYAHHHRSDYAGVWWLNAAKPADGTGFEGVERALVDVGAIFIRGLDRVEDRAAAARQALDLIAHGGFEKPWLLVYDNVDDARVLREWPPVGNAQILMTTRIGGWPAAVSTVEIEEWPLPEAVAYLCEESGRHDLTDADAGRVAETLGCLPLALSHAAALLRARPNITPAIYIEGLSRRMNEAPKDAEYPRAVVATFQEALAEAEREAQGAVAVMSLAAFFAPDDVPEELFRQPPECYPPDLAALVATPGAVDEAIGALAHLSLVDFHLEGRTFSAHRLVLAAARDALGESAPAWSSSALGSLASAFPAAEDSRTWPACERLVAHVRVVAAHASEDSPALARLLGNTGIYLEQRAALAEVQPLYERTRGIFERLAAQDPGNAGWQRDLSVSYDRIGDVQSARGNLDGALQAYQDGLDIREKLAAQDPGNAEWQRDLSVSFNKIGDVQSARGDLDGALQAYQVGLAIAEKLAAQDPGNAEWQRDLSVSFDRIGDVQRARGNLKGALQAYQDSLDIREKLAAQDSGNAGWQRDLSVSFDRIGDVQHARGDLDGALQAYQNSHEIFENLTAQDPGNAGWQRGLSVSFSKIGDVQSAHGNLDGALQAYQDALDITEKLAAQDPGNAGWQRDLSISFNKMGDVQSARGNLDGALEAYSAGRDIAEKLAAQDPGNANWQRDLIISHVKLAEIARRDRLTAAAARQHYDAALAIARELHAHDRLAPTDAWMVADLEARLDRLPPPATDS